MARNAHPAHISIRKPRKVSVRAVVARQTAKARKGSASRAAVGRTHRTNTQVR